MSQFFIQFSRESPAVKLVVAVVMALVAAYVINVTLERIFKAIIHRADNGKTGNKLRDVRRAETYMNIGGAMSRTFITGLCLYIGWRLTGFSTGPVALVGAGAVFIVLASVTIGPLLRDITNGTLMMIEQWYNVGDHIVIDPFANLSGVVERLNLRSTKLRSLNGEEIWIHNQYIQAVRVTPRGVRTISVDTFVSNLERGRSLIERTFKTLPIGPTMIVSPLVITEEEELGSVWRITAVGQTTPGRAWMIETFAVEALKKADASGHTEPVIAYGPIVRYTDEVAEQRLKRSIRTRSKSKSKPKAQPKPKSDAKSLL